MAVFVHHNSIVPQTCGLGVAGIFRNQPNPYSDHNHSAIKSFTPSGGCDYLVAGFTAQLPAYKEAYEGLVKRYGEPVFRSDKRKNRRTNHMFFFAIWDTKEKK